MTSHFAHTTGASDAGAYAASVPSVAAPSQLGPRRALAKSGGRGSPWFCSHATYLDSLGFRKERDVDARACEEGAQIQCCRVVAPRKAACFGYVSYKDLQAHPGRLL